MKLDRPQILRLVKLGIIVMRALITAIIILCTATAGAMSPEYDSSRQLVEQHSPNDKTPAAERVFVICSTNSVTLHFHDGISVREIIDATALHGQKVSVYILRESQKTTSVFDEVVEPSARPAFILKPRDLVFIYSVDGIPRW